MTVSLTNTVNELSILIICDDEDFAEYIAVQTESTAYNPVVTTLRPIFTHSIADIQCQVLITTDDSGIALNLFRELTSSFETTNRPILISISDNPSPELFLVADQVISNSYVPYLGQIISTQMQRIQQTISTEKLYLELKAQNQLINQELAITNRTSTEISLLKHAIVHSVSHELRTPMLQVKSAVALLNEDEHINRTIMELAMEATTRLESGIRNVTLLNELMNESADALSFNSVPIAQVVQASIRNLGKSWERKKEVERIEVTATNKACTAVCDKQRLTIAIQLLLDNALKFSQEKVVVEIKDHGNAVTVSIRDQGIGIPENQIAHIFEPFYQIDGSSTRRFGGMGIGLAIVRLILDQHSSAIRLQSTPGKGSLFAFDLPVKMH